MFINLVNLSSIIIKYAFAHIGGKLDELLNQGRETIARNMIYFLLENMSKYHHHHHVTPILYHNATPLLPMDHHLYHVTFQHSHLHGSTSSSCHPSPLYVDHHLLLMYTITLVT